MILNEINYKMPIYKDCTLGEILFVGISVLLIELVIFSLIFRFIFGYASIGVAIAIVSFFHITKYFLTRLQHFKYGKPHGYYQQAIYKKLSDLGLRRNFYITRLGKWSVKRVNEHG